MRSLCSPKIYLEEFRRSKNSRIRLLNKDFADPRRDEEAPKSVMITFQISFNHLLGARQTAANLLSFMSFFDPQAISEHQLRDGMPIGTYETDSIDEAESGDDNEEESTLSELSAEDSFADDLIMLMDYSLIKELANKQLGMHALVQLATRQWLIKQKRLVYWRKRFIKYLFSYFPQINSGEWIRLESEEMVQGQALLPYVNSMLEDLPGRDSDFLEWSIVLENASNFMSQKGKGIEAERLLLPVIKAKERIFGEKHPTTLDSKILFMRAYHAKGEWEVAKELGIDLLDLKKDMFGECDTATTTAMNDLAVAYQNLGNLKKAEELYKQAFRVLEQMKSEERQRVSDMKSNLALVVQRQGRYVEAEALGREALFLSKERFGINALETQRVKINLALALTH